MKEGAQTQSLNRTLSLRHVVLFGLAFMAPVTVFATYGVAGEIAQGMMPTAYAMAMVVMLFTAISYGMLVKAFPIAGSAYTFTQRSISPHLGFLVGWTILLDYVFSPMISSLLVGIFVSNYFPGVPMAVWIISFIVIVTTVNILGIRLAANVNAILVVAQLLLCVLFVVFAIQGLLAGKGSGTLVSLTPFYDPNVQMGGLMAVIPILCFTFLGFDAVTTLAEETKNPVKTLPTAIILITFIGGLLYVADTYFAQLVHPSFTFQDPESAVFEIFGVLKNAFLDALFLVVSMTAAFASAMASGASASRILYAMGRENVLPRKFFGYLSPRFQTPVLNLLLIGLIAMSALFFDLMTATAFINYGALFAFVFVNLSVISHFFIRKKQRSGVNVIRYLLVPAIGAIITGIFWAKLDMHSLILGTAWLVIGIGYLAYITKMFRLPPPNIHLDDPEQNTTSDIF
ncbi:UNVERIFIED_CONTAM: amino acid transporter [Brevibacillus sp. OAP136]